MRYKLLPVDNIVPIVAVAAGERPWPAFCGAIRLTRIRHVHWSLGWADCRNCVRENGSSGL